ncbi:symmetrical bis(5'-nucleosyl)-tetraphosphatase [Methylophaga sp. OBS4]|uniref:symmetrical bis(5'-nucleosyl)-tetraphosphatase n=1 Tax=Methylophaga sp. OBS4 TaxID=2991935 RepID=UPI00224FBC0C|nr:symmetrical bis(5'-nucleosyl)-tetraphosphatase [Methylophaga sp. OBS4]MCX4187247.1 symmetrical bis(5'-nucleosyl)-tetraphosphatase [Methylophaga sp. OBS4]
MAVYAIGDVQGCYDELIKMLDRIQFDPAADQIWLAGDLVNRGPNSVDVLRLAKQLGDSCVPVLGNHDLHLLANAAGVVEFQHHMDTIESVLKAPDCDELVGWLRQQRLFYHDPVLNFSMVHAGLPPEWSISEALSYAAEVEAIIKSDNWRDFFEHMYGNKPKRWSTELTGWDRLRFITNCFTRLRYCHEDGRLALKFKGAPENKPLHQKPWFEMPNRASADDRIVFGHWSTLGVGQYGNVFSLDSGAVWGETLTAVRIDREPYEWVTIQADPEGLPFAKNKQQGVPKRWL